MESWVIFEIDKLRPNIGEITLLPLKGIKNNELKILKFFSEEDAKRALETETSLAYKSKNKNKDCNYLILKVYE